MKKPTKFLLVTICVTLILNFYLEVPKDIDFIDDTALLNNDYSSSLINKNEVSFSNKYLIENNGITCDLNEISACDQVFGLNRFLDTYSRSCLNSLPETIVKKTFQSYVRFYVKGSYRVNKEERINIVGIKQKLSSTIGEYVSVFKSFDTNANLLVNENLSELYYPIRIRPVFDIACDPGVYKCEYVVSMYITHESEALSDYIWKNGLTDGIVKN